MNKAYEGFILSEGEALFRLISFYIDKPRKHGRIGFPTDKLKATGLACRLRQKIEPKTTTSPYLWRFLHERFLKWPEEYRETYGLGHGCGRLQHRLLLLLLLLLLLMLHYRAFVCNQSHRIQRLTFGTRFVPICHFWFVPEKWISSLSENNELAKSGIVGETAGQIKMPTKRLLTIHWQLLFLKEICSHR